MKSYVVCPDCGTVFGVAERIDDLEVLCHKCKEKLLVNVNEQGSVVMRIGKTTDNRFDARKTTVIRG
jgi:DNA-directed RNA polymerase subunit RPC12/RpoP